MAAQLGGAESNLVCYRACDINPVCRQALLEHPLPSQAQHIFGDLMARQSEECQFKMQAVRKHWNKEAELARHGGASKKDAVAKLGIEMVDQLRIVLDNEVSHCEAWCYRCRRHCPRSPAMKNRAHVCA